MRFASSLAIVWLGAWQIVGAETIEIPGPLPGATRTNAWLRCHVKVPGNWTTASGRSLYRESITLQVNGWGAKHDVWLNGKKVATGRADEGFIRHKIPAGILQKDQWNSLAIQVQGARQIDHAPILSGYFLEARLAGEWEILPDFNSTEHTPRAEQPVKAVYKQFLEASSKLDRPGKLFRGPSLSVEESLKTFTVHEDLELDLILAEPQIAQPLWMHFDFRGRLWVCEYRQYPYPAGVKVLSRDKYYRSAYDRIPPPPPRHDRGADRISVHEDRDGDGRYETHSIFMDGLNLCTSVAVGQGGVWMLHPPYLLFVPDENFDAKPDGAPVVHLSGFGLQDTHSVANSLTLGPDGWLYGAHGSTTASQITVARMGEKESFTYQEGAGIWRYHPKDHRFEFVVQGGGNPFSIEFDLQHRLFSGSNEGNTRGYHYRIGGYYRKGTRGGKYGPSRQPYRFGALEPMQHATKIPRFSHSLVVMEDDAWPELYRGHFLSVDPLARRVMFSRRLPHGSTFRTEDVHAVLNSSDPAFRPVDIKVGPDGNIYIADFYEYYIAHGQHFQGQIDPSTGRIYRLRKKGAAIRSVPDFLQVPAAKLRRHVDSERKWEAFAAFTLMGERGLLDEGSFQLDPRLAVTPHERCEFALRLSREPDLSDENTFASSQTHIPLAEHVEYMLTHWNSPTDLEDPHLPLCVWWAAEAHPPRAGWFASPKVWGYPMFTEHVAGRLVRRALLRGQLEDHELLPALFRAAPDAAGRARLLAGLKTAADDGASLNLTDEIVAAIGEVLPLPLRVRRGESNAVKEAIGLLKGGEENAEALVSALADSGSEAAGEALLATALNESATESLRASCFAALAGFSSERIPTDVLAVRLSLTPGLRTAADRLLGTKKSWAEKWLALPEAERGEIPLDLQAQLDALGLSVPEADGKNIGNTHTYESVDEVLKLVRTEPGNPYRGKALFLQRCASCHRFFDKGKAVGPDLTPLQRNDLPSLLHHILHPAAEIREGFGMVVVKMESGDVRSGFIISDHQSEVLLRGMDGGVTRLRVESISPPVSVMPPGLLNGLSAQQVRDLIAYLRIGQPISK